MVTINTTMRAVQCTDCGEMLELRGKNPEAHVITAQQFERKHLCGYPKLPAYQKPEQARPVDRWKQLFVNITL